tara:strand:+ start:867 stop:1076 length:210 start_codon:yes stop_codon:yes gene_type:complete
MAKAGIGYTSSIECNRFVGTDNLCGQVSVMGQINPLRVAGIGTISGHDPIRFIMRIIYFLSDSRSNQKE